MTQRIPVLLGYFVSVSLLNYVAGTPGYGSYEYNGHGHRGYNEIGTVNKVVDYYSKPQYAFGYEVEDYYQQLSMGRWEVRDGDVTQGQYRVLLPDGRIQIVSYIADKHGYRPKIQYIGKGVHPPPPPAYAKIKPPKNIPDPYLRQPISEVPVPVPVEEGPHPNSLAIFPSPTPQPALYGSGPLKLELNPLAINPVPVRKFKQRFGYGAQRFEGHGHGPSSFPIFHRPNYKREVKSSPSKISRKRALLYGRTLFRRDIPEPETKPR